MYEIGTEHFVPCLLIFYIIFFLILSPGILCTGIVPILTGILYPGIFFPGYFVITFYHWTLADDPKISFPGNNGPRRKDYSHGEETVLLRDTIMLGRMQGFGKGGGGGSAQFTRSPRKGGGGSSFGPNVKKSLHHGPKGAGSRPPPPRIRGLTGLDWASYQCYDWPLCLSVCTDSQSSQDWVGSMSSCNVVLRIPS